MFYLQKKEKEFSLWLENLGMSDWASHFQIASQLPAHQPYLVLKRPDIRDVLVVKSESVHFENLTREFLIACTCIRTKVLLETFFPHMKGVLLSEEQALLSLQEDKVDGWMTWIDEAKNSPHGGLLIQKFPIAGMIPESERGIYYLSYPADFPLKAELVQAFAHLPTQKSATAERAFTAKIEDKAIYMVSAQPFMDTISIHAAKIHPDGSNYVAKSIEGALEDAENLAISLLSAFA